MYVSEVREGKEEEGEGSEDSVVGSEGVVDVEGGGEEDLEEGVEGN